MVGIDQECQKKDREAFELRKQLEALVHQARDNRASRDRQIMDNDSIDVQINQQSQHIKMTREQIQEMQLEMNRLRQHHADKQTLLQQKQLDIQRKQDALLSS